MLIPIEPAEYEFTIKRSRFIAYAKPVSTPEEARSWIGKLRQEHPDSRHVVHAFITGKGREHQGLSDDGEPAGTAGKPVWEVLKGRGITNLGLYVVRYFGGIKLGTGGLVKAYGDAAKGVLDILPAEGLIEKRSFSLQVSYAVYEGAMMKIREHQGVVDNETFDTGVVIEATLPAVEAEALEEVLRDLTAGRGKLMWKTE